MLRYILKFVVRAPATTGLCSPIDWIIHQNDGAACSIPDREPLWLQFSQLLLYRWV